VFFSDQVAEKESLSIRNLAYSQKFVEWTSTANDLCERYRETFGEETNARNKRWLVKRKRTPA